MCVYVRARFALAWTPSSIRSARSAFIHSLFFCLLRGEPAASAIYPLTPQGNSHTAADRTRKTLDTPSAPAWRKWMSAMHWYWILRVAFFFRRPLPLGDTYARGCIARRRSRRRIAARPRLHRSRPQGVHRNGLAARSGQLRSQVIEFLIALGESARVGWMFS